MHMSAPNVFVPQELPGQQSALVVQGVQQSPHKGPPASRLVLVLVPASAGGSDPASIGGRVPASGDGPASAGGGGVDRHVTVQLLVWKSQPGAPQSAHSSSKARGTQYCSPARNVWQTVPAPQSASVVHPSPQAGGAMQVVEQPPPGWQKGVSPSHARQESG